MRTDLTRQVVREVYCEVLFELAEQMGQVESVLGDLSGVAGLIESEPDFFNIMNSRVIKNDEKVEIVTRVFKGHVSDLTLNFLIILARKDRMSLLKGISSRYEMLLDYKQDRRPVEVTVAAPLDETQTASLEDRIAQAINSSVKLTVNVDPDIIGGIVIRKGDKVIDSSVRTALKRAVGGLKMP